MAVARAVLFGLVGLAFGSFLTVLVHRTPRRQRAMAPFPCPHCLWAVLGRDSGLSAYVIQGGRCRHCGGRIPIEHPLVEALTSALFVIASLRFDSFWRAALVAPFLGLMVAFAAIDIRHWIIPNAIVRPAIVVFTAAVAVLALLSDASLARALLGLLAFFGAVFALHFVYPRGIGMGDVRLAALIGLVLGALGWGYVAVAAGVAALGAGIGGIAVVAAAFVWALSRPGRAAGRGDTRQGSGRLVSALGAGRAALRSSIPYGPFLALGAILSALLGPEIVDAYLRFRY